jgi:hypothetical protein
MKFLIPLTFSLLVVACAAPQATQQQVQNLLRGQCKDLFLNTSLGSYQHVVGQISGKAVFAVAEDKQTGAQKCGMARSNVDVGSQAWGLAGNAVSWEQLEAIAITRCESIRGVSESCMIFAKNNEIVWKKKVNVDFK